MMDEGMQQYYWLYFWIYLRIIFSIMAYYLESRYMIMSQHTAEASYRALHARARLSAADTRPQPARAFIALQEMI